MTGSTLRWLQLQWPRKTEADQLVNVTRILATSEMSPIVLEAVGEAGRVRHRLGIPMRFVGSIRRQLKASVPGLGLEDLAERGPLNLQRATTVSLSSRRRPLRVSDGESIVRGLLTALSGVGRDEVVVLQWVLDGVLPPLAIPNDFAPGAERWSAALVDAVRFAPQPLDAEARTAVRAKRAEHGWRAIGRVAVRGASKSRQRQLIGQVLAALRTAEAPGVQVGLADARTRPVEGATTWRWPLRLNTQEVAILAAWPIGDTASLPVYAARSRSLAPTNAIPRHGRVLGVGDGGAHARPVAVSSEDSLRHLHLLGPTGTGKSTLLLNLILQDLAAGRGLVLIEPKGDLVEAVLARIPDKRRADVIVLDPSEYDRPVGLNPLATAGRSPELVADQLLAVFHGLYSAYWGPRTQDILGAALLTLARTPNMTLVALPLLLTDATFRRRVIAKLDDPLGLEPFWASFEAWSEAERTTAIAPVLNKVRPFLLRSSIRRIVGQTEPAWSLRDAFNSRKVVLVSLAKGNIGPEAATLFGSLVVSQLWQAILSRSAVPTDHRRPAFIYLDEFADVLHLPTDLGDALVLSRGMGVGWTLAHQHLAQLSPDLRAAVRANARSTLCFQLEHQDARDLAARGGELDPTDFEELPAFHAYARLVAGGSVQHWCSVRTLPARAATSSAADMHKASTERYGVAADEVDAALRRGLTAPRSTPTDDITPRRRTGGAS